MTDDSSLQTGWVTPRAGRDRLVIDPLCRASARAGLGGLAGRLAIMRDWMGDGLEQLEADLSVLSLHAGKRDDLARRAASHMLSQPGKRIRPICAFLGAELAGIAVDDRVRALAVASELVHAATLLHDDVIDEGTERRGAPAARMVYGNSASILAGDYLLIDALERVAAIGAPRVLAGLLSTISAMVAAEALQLEGRGIFEADRARCLRVIDGKTAALFRWALVAPAELAGVESLSGLLTELGTRLGVAFQVIDDVLDLKGDPAWVGKDLLADLRQGKLTWPLLLASERDAGVARMLAAIADDAEPSAPDATARLLDAVRQSGALEAARAFAEEQRDLGREALDALPATPARAALGAVIDAAVDRSR